MEKTQQPFSDAHFYDEGLRKHMVSTYALVTQGLVATALSAAIVGSTSLMNLFVSPEGGFTGLGLAVSLAPLAVLLLFMFGMVGKSLASTKMVFWALVALLGPSLAVSVFQYTGASVVNAAVAAIATFLGASLYGYTTQKSLASMGSFLVMGLIGLIAASVINIFLGSSALDFALSVMAVLIFTGLTAWETQDLKSSYDLNLTSEETEKLKYLFAINLYLNIINLFRAILNLTGDRS